MIIDNIDPKTVRGSVGLMLREERLARGLSFEQAADAARVSYRYVICTGWKEVRGIILFFSSVCWRSTTNRSTSSWLTANNKKALFERRAFIMFEK